MFKKVFSSIILFFGICSTAIFSQEIDNKLNKLNQNNVEIDSLDNMPILEKNKFGNTNAAPVEQRGKEFRKFLAASVKIVIGNTSGSGTIVHYDKDKNLAYVATCGHLWQKGIMTAEEGKKAKLKCKIVTWYHNDKVLDAPKSYEGDVIFYSYYTGQDTGLVTFKPDWEPNVFPIGPVDYDYVPGQHAHSLGCDSGSEVAHYDVTIMKIQEYQAEKINIQTWDIITEKNSPRPGRSGGGMMNDQGEYIGTCWGTQYRDGTGKGYFVPLKVIHRFWKQQKDYAFLLEQKLPTGSARTIPIIDRGGSKKTYNGDYILLPADK